MAIIRTIGQRRVVVDASGEAARHGIKPGMTVAEARALHGQLACFDEEPAADRRAREALGRWLTRFTPVVSCEWADDDDDDDDGGDPPAALWLDLTGCERLFGGIARIAEAVGLALRRFNIPARVAVAPTVGSAWAFAVAARRSLTIVEADVLPHAIRPLPVMALRLSGHVLRRLDDLGLVTVADVMALPRGSLPARFGPLLSRRLDQLTGELGELLVGLSYDPPVTASHRVDAPIESPRQIAIVFEWLLDSLLVDLARRGRGARTLHLRLTPDQGWRRPVVRREIALSWPHRHRKTLLELIVRGLEGIDCEHGFVAFQLGVPVHEPIAETQPDLCDGQPHAQAVAFGLILQRLRARLGDDAVIRPQLVESYLPERAWRPGAGEGAKPGSGTLAGQPPVRPSRPLTLFPTPVEIGVVCEPSGDHAGRPRQFTWQRDARWLVHIVGPERIGCEWWRGHRPTRDYFEVEDQAGLRFWIFRVSRVRRTDGIAARWFLHGRFD